MTFRWILTGSIAAALVAVPSVAQDAPLRLDAHSAWQVDYGEESCALRRAFGSGDASVQLEIMQQAPRAYFQVTAAATSLGLSRSEARVRFEPDETPQVPSYLRSGTADELAVIRYTDSLQRNVPAQSTPYIDWSDDERDKRERSISGLVIENGFERDVTLQTGEMHSAMEALRTCMSDLYGSWGVDLDAHRTLARPVQIKAAQQMLQRLLRILPADSFRVPSPLPPVVRLIVGTDGKVARCRVHFTEWSEQVSRDVCQMLTKDVRYDPALDAAGKAIVSFDTLVLPLHN